MSRNFEVQIEVWPCPYKGEGHISDMLFKWGMEIDSDVESFDHEHGDGWCYWGCIQLTDGQTEEQMHEALRAILLDKALTTRWRYVDDLPWDEVLESPPLKPHQ
jgi:hypothetical protein